MSNGNKNIVKKSKEQQIKAKRKTLRRDIYSYITTALPAVLFGIVFLLSSFINSETNFSILLAVYAGLITLVFEVDEWQGYFSKKTKKEGLVHKLFDKFSPILCFVGLFEIACFIYTYSLKDKIDMLPESISKALPNMLTALVLLIYFISYTVRKCMIKHDEIAELDKKNEEDEV